MNKRVRPIHDRLLFEAFLAELSSTFVRVPAEQVDAQIVSALRQIVEFLDIDRSGFGEMVNDQLEITHSYELPGIPPSPRIILEEHFPSYARKIRMGEAFRLPDDLPPEAAVEREFLARTGLKSNLTIPLKVTGAVVGGIGFGSFRTPIEWPDEHVRRLCLVGDIFTNALARKRPDGALRTLAARLLTAQEEERRRLAREMHDDWTQRLAILSFDVAELEKHVGDPAAAHPLLRSMRDRLVSLSEDVHALSRQLHPAILDDLGLAEALRSECAAFSRREGITVAYSVAGGTPTLPRAVALCVYRVVQEALRNLAKHAAVREARVTLATLGPELVLQVCDAGVGFEPRAQRTALGLGLASMEERVRLVRGTLAINSAPGRGTTVEVRARLQEEDA
jgi:two-component system, NarL family, sensor kinase